MLLERWDLLQRQAQCLFYSADPNLVVYDECPVGPSRLLGQGKNYQPILAEHGSNLRTIAAKFVPDPLLQFLYRRPPHTMTWWGPPCAPLLFMHELRARGGSPYLVCVWGNILDQTGDDEGFGIDIYVPSGWLSDFKRTASGENYGSVFPTGKKLNPQRLSIFAGQVDPNDPSHFTIRYQLDGKVGRVDGWLEELPGTGTVHVKIHNTSQ